MKIRRNQIYTALTISKEELIDLVASIDYVSTPECLPTYPIFFAAYTDDKVIKGMAGLDKEENQVLYVEGKLQTRSWEDKEGNKRYITEVVADNFTVLANKNRSDDASDREQDPLSTILSNETEPLGDLPF